MRTALILMLSILASCLTAAAANDDVTVRLPAGTSSLLDVGLYRVGYRYFGKEAVFFPVGWMGHFDDASGIACHPDVEQNDKKTLLLHCPWRGGAGISFLEYDLALPKVTPITFTYAIAMRTDAVGKSDGVTFRTFIGEKGDLQRVLDKHCDSDAWEEHKEDLSAYAGRTVTIRFETDPGPARNSSFDFSLWGDPKMVVGSAGGGVSEALDQMLSDPRLSKEYERTTEALLNDGAQGICPSTAEPGKSKLSKEKNDWIFEVSGAGTLVRYRLDPSQRFLDGLSVEIIANEKDGLGRFFAGLFGKKAEYAFKPCLGSGPVLALKLKGEAAEKPVAPNLLQRELLSCVRNGDAIILTERYAGEGAAITLETTLSLSRHSLVVQAQSRDAGIGELRYGLVRAPLRRVIHLPYLTFVPLMYLPDQLLYVSLLPDWTASSASSLAADAARYGAKTDGTRNALRERAFLTVSPFIGEVLANIPNPPSPFLKEISGRLVYDIWGGMFEENAQWLRELKGYGLDHTILLYHVWQRGGYDNEYPTVMPANAKLGGDEGMKTLCAAARDTDCKICLHENYVDFYPNSEAYNPNDVSLSSKGEPVKAWFNKGTKQQSFAYKPNAIMKYAREFSPEIHKRYGTTGCFLDVHSAVPPWFHVDFRATEPEAGMFPPVWAAHRALWKFERETHGGPVFGEGHSHFFWSGCLDGVEAQLEGGEDALPILDFDLLKMHPLILNHGMGYYERWYGKNNPTARRRGIPTEEKLDKYRALEIAFGHAGFLGTSTWRCVPFAAREYYMVTPFSARYATARPTRILYEIGGRPVTGSIAAALGRADRLSLEYDNGLRLWVNLSDEDWTVEGQVIPQFGFHGAGAGVTGGTTRRAGVISDYVETDDLVFADARSLDASALTATGFRAIVPRVASFKYLGDNKIAFSYEFKVGQPLDKDYATFVHFVNPKIEVREGIGFQQDHRPTTPTSQWKANTTVADGPYQLEIPGSVGSEKYVWYLGLLEKGGGRLELLGKNDGHGRIELGALEVVSKEGRISDVKFIPPAQEKNPAEVAKEASERRLNLKKVPLDFGKLVTAGCVVLRRQAEGKWEMIPVPRGETFQVSLRPELLDPKLRAGQLRVTALDASRKELRALPTKAADDRVTFTVGAAREYYYLVE